MVVVSIFNVSTFWGGGVGGGGRDSDFELLMMQPLSLFTIEEREEVGL